jgi:GTP diphosphokinase / guanosine-3',5'-bis(diphosphate) 3'-diphosphatase
MPTTRRFEDILDAISVYYPGANIAFVQRAYMYSAKVHAGQVRKSGEPYLIHPLEVAWLLTQMRLDEASIATGLLHDTVEDTLATLEEIESMFGTEVSSLVDGVTKLSQIRFDTQEHKQAENFRKMLVAMAKDIRVILVKLADRLHNMRTLEHLREDKQRRIAQETIDIYAPLANRLGIHWVKSELEDWSFRYLHPADYELISKRMREVSAAREDYVSAVVSALHDELQKRGIECDVYGRPKHLYSIFKKMRSRHIEFEQVYDLIAFRVLVDDVSQCYEVLGHVHSLWHPIPGRFKDYIAMPKPNRYQSLHTSVIGPEGERIEIQIRTHEMHRIAEEGIAAHWKYKERDKERDHNTQPLSHKGQQQFAWLRQLLEWQQDLKDPNEFLDVVKYDLFADEVFVFTPRGEVISLQRGATPVDFAFAIHTQVGIHCAGAKVNGRMVPLRYELKNGDMVEIVTSAQQHPSKDWLSFVGTARAKAKIRAIVRTEERQRSEVLGKELLERELKRYDISLQKLLRDGSLQRLAAETKHQSVEALFMALGYGRTTAHQIVEKIVPGKQPQAEPKAVFAPIIKKDKRAGDGVVVQGLGDVLVRFGRCCSPLPGEPIIGFITRGHGITVHLSTCARAMDADPVRRIDVSWEVDGKFVRPVGLRVLTTDRPGILATISKTFGDNGMNIAQANCKVISEDRAVNDFEILLRDVDQLRHIIAVLKSITGVIGVERI